MTADERLALIRVKIERAKKHLGDLQIARQSFFDTHPYEVSTDRNGKTGNAVYYLSRIHEMPPIFSVVAGDVLHNLRSALDHLAYQLVLVGSPGITPKREVSFPIYSDATEYETDRGRKVEGMSEAAIDAIDAVKPYKGGNDYLWRLSQLNNIDKHRLLVTVFAELRAQSVYANGTGRLFVVYPKSLPCALKVGDILHVTEGPDSELDKDTKFLVDLTIDEPRIMQCESLIDTLQHMADLVDRIVSGFKLLLG